MACALVVKTFLTSSRQLIRISIPDFNKHSGRLADDNSPTIGRLNDNRGVTQAVAVDTAGKGPAHSLIELPVRVF